MGHKYFFLVVITMDYTTETSFKHYEPHFKDTYGQMVDWNRRQWALEREIICCFRLNCCMYNSNPGKDSI